MDTLTYCEAVTLICLLIFSSGQATHSSVLRSLNARVIGSSEHSPTFAWAHAVDGSSTTVSTCECCAATQYENDPWMKIDLSRLYRVSIIEVTGRTDVTDPFEGIKIYLHTRSDWQTSLAGNVTIPTVKGSVPYYNGTFENPVIARFVTLQLTGKHLLLVCEVSIYSRDCHGGHYGTSCDRDCGHCLGDEVCDHVTGACTSCEDGYAGSVCKDECPAGTFGRNCSSTCHCFNNKSCNHVTGRCPDHRCHLGWHWSNCSLPCDKGRFGENCQEHCGSCENNAACDIRDGTCNSCSIGYIGPTCKQVCPPGRYGRTCSLTCEQCDDGLCDIVTGACLEGCLPGYQGRFCKKDYNFLREASVKFSMSSVYQGLDANKAVDGRYEGIPLECICCSETKHGRNSWWQAEFGTPEFIKQITIFWRIDEKTVRYLTGFQILLSLTGTFSEGPVYVHNNTELQGNNIAASIQDVAAKFVRIQRAGILSICEVEVLLSDIRCPVNTYGRSCTPCGYCKNGTCDRVIGHCPGGCNENFDDEKCLTMKTLQTQQSSSIAIEGVMVGMAIIIALDLVIVGVICLIQRMKRFTVSDEPKVSWNCKQPDQYSSLDHSAYESKYEARVYESTN